MALKGYKQTPEHRAKRSRAMRGQNTYPRSPESRKKMSEAHLRSWQDPDYRKKTLAGLRSLEYREKRRQIRLRQRFPKKMTSIESALHHEFKKRRLKFEMHRTMFGRFQPDFVFDSVSLIVQADGYYWHNLKGRRQDDGRFNKDAREAGWTVWRFAESEILQHPEACGRAVARFVRSH